MARFVYSFILSLLSPLVLAYLWFSRGGKDKAYRLHFSERLSSAPLKHTKVLVHLASVGEVMSAAPLLKKWQQTEPELTFTFSCNTPTGRDLLHKHFGGKAQICYLPIDLPWLQKRFIKAIKPSLTVLFETELWPNLLHFAKKQGSKTALINARLSEKSFADYQKVAPLARTMLNNLDIVLTHAEQDAAHFKALGAKHITALGSLKFDINQDEQKTAEAEALRARFGERFVWIAGSTHPGEDAQILAAHTALGDVINNPLLILVPRHQERFDDVYALAKRSFNTQRKSTLSSDTPLTETQVLLGDTLGELFMLYGCADLALIGGSLIERGGHNPLEAAVYGIPVLSGPHVFNFTDVYQKLTDAKAGVVFNHAHELPAQLIALAQSESTRQQQGQQALNFMAQNQGAMAHTLTHLKALLDHE